MIRIFRHYIPRWSLLLLAMEGALYVLAVYGGVGYRFHDMPPDPLHAELLLPRALVFSLVLLLSQVATGRYQRLMDDGIVGEVLGTTLSFVIGLMAMSVLFYVFPDMFLGRGAFGYALLLAGGGALVVRWLFFHFILDLDLLKRHILVLGADAKAARIPGRHAAGRARYQVVGFLALPGQPLAVPPERLVRQEGNLLDFSRTLGVDEIVYSLDQEEQLERHMNDLLLCKVNGIRVMDLATFYEQEQRIIALECLHARWWLEHAEGVSQGALRDVGKKLFDLTMSLLLLLTGIPIMLATALAIWIESGLRGPIIYRQTRVGFGGKPFQLLKFRSMIPDAEQDGVARWASDNDQRVTRVGRIIRATRIDEMPQIFNVLKGEMSFVGPRPERPEFVSRLQDAIPFYRERLRVKPGITGWAQICYGYGNTEDDALAKLQYDLYYVKNHSLFLDWLVVIQSVEVVIFGKSRPGPHRP